VVRFHETNLGRQHYERDFPALVRELRELNASMQHLISLQVDVTAMAARAIVRSGPKEDLGKIIEYEYKLDVNEPAITAYFASMEEFMLHIGKLVSKKFHTELHFSKWMLASGFAYTSTVFYAP